MIDNCEHLAPQVASLVREMLEVNPGLRILATSRERLGVPGEFSYPLPPLSCPEEGGDIENVDSVLLFGDRARATAPHFEVTVDNRRFVAEICRRLDGIPLAIELAAARVNSFSPSRSSHSSRPPSPCARIAGPNALSRHRTLRAAIDWSSDLLDPLEQALFRRLSIFRGGFDMDAAIGVCGYEPLDATLVLSVLPARR